MEKDILGGPSAERLRPSNAPLIAESQLVKIYALFGFVIAAEVDNVVNIYTKNTQGLNSIFEFVNKMTPKIIKKVYFYK